MATLITGATGNIGGRVVDLLVGLGQRPRIFVRNPEKARARFGDRVEVAVGDLADASTLSPAMKSVDAVLLINGEGPDLARRDEEGAKVAAAAGVCHIVKLSALSAALPPGAQSALGDWHARGEAAVRASGVAWTLLQPTGFMSNALAWAGSIKREGAVSAPTGEGRIAMIHPDDIAEVAAKALSSRALEGQTLALTGPAALTYSEMTAIIGEAMGRHLSFNAISDDEARARLLKSGMPGPLADGLVALWRSVREGRVAAVTDTVERVLGRRPKEFKQWAHENAAAFA